MHKKQQKKRENLHQQQQQQYSSSAKAATKTAAATTTPAGEGKNEQQQQGQGRRHTHMQQPAMGPVNYERPKAQKPREPPLVSSSSSSSSSPAAEREKEKESVDVLLDTMALLVKRAVDPFVNPAPIQNYALLIGDISILITFRTVEDMLLTPMPSLDITASPDLIRNGLIAYADPLSAATHVSSVMSDGMSLGCFWLAAVLMGRAQAVEHDVNTSFTLSTWATVRTWLTLVNIRLGVLFLHVRICVCVIRLHSIFSFLLLLHRLTPPPSTTHTYKTKKQALTIGEGVDLTHVQYEMSALFVTMLAWRWLNCAVTRYFTGF